MWWVYHKLARSSNGGPRRNIVCIFHLSARISWNFLPWLTSIAIIAAYLIGIACFVYTLGPWTYSAESLYWTRFTLEKDTSEAKISKAFRWDQLLTNGTFWYRPPIDYTLLTIHKSAMVTSNRNLLWLYQPKRRVDGGGRIDLLPIYEQDKQVQLWSRDSEQSVTEGTTWPILISVSAVKTIQICRWACLDTVNCIYNSMLHHRLKELFWRRYWV